MSLMLPAWQCQHCERYNSGNRTTCRICGKEKTLIILPENAKTKDS